MFEITTSVVYALRLLDKDWFIRTRLWETEHSYQIRLSHKGLPFWRGVPLLLVLGASIVALLLCLLNFQAGVLERTHSRITAAIQAFVLMWRILSMHLCSFELLHAAKRNSWPRLASEPRPLGYAWNRWMLGTKSNKPCVSTSEMTTWIFGLPCSNV